MPRFNVGDMVTYVRNDQMGSIKTVYPECEGRQTYEVFFSGQNKQICLENYLEPYTDITDPFERIRQNRFNNYEDFTQINTTFKLNNTNNNTLSTLMASKTIFKAYQYKPLLKFLNSENRRIIVADEVGLGKTIEAGHIMLELRARNELHNALVICPNSLVEKWRDELNQKFGLDFKIYERLDDLLEDLRQSPGTLKGIINYEKIRLNNEEERKIQKIKNGELAHEQWVVQRETLHHFICYNNISFDFLLCDEAHRLRNPNQSNKGVRHILERTKSAVFLTATPIMISEENLFNLLNLLDENRFDNLPQFQNALEENKPFILALSKLTNPHYNLREIFNELDQAHITVEYKTGSEENELCYSREISIGERYKDISLYREIMQKSQEQDTPQLRVQLQSDISSISVINNIFTRTRKRDVTVDTQTIRDPQTHIVALYKDEQTEFDHIITEYTNQNQYVDLYGDVRLPQGAALGLIQKKRRIASSVYGYLNRPEDLDKGIDRYEDKPDAKLDKLLEIIQAVVDGDGKKIIIFALFRNTIKYLNIRLKKKGYNSVIIHGEIDNRSCEIERFRTDPNIKILLSSEVGSEGLDMQFCDSVVNYDLPWNPMVVEQRIGRIDRFGQQSPRVHIYTLVVANSIQEEIYSRLLDRINIFKECIGDLEAIFDNDTGIKGLRGRNIQEIFSNLERELYCNDIAPEIRQDQIDAIAQAIERNKQTLNDIGENLTNTLTNDAYFTNEINNIQQNNRYITSWELKNYIHNLIHNHLRTCNFYEDSNNKGLYILSIPPAEPRCLTNFIERQTNTDKYREYEREIRRFNNSIRDETEIHLVFDRDKIQQYKNCYYIDPFHPLILAAMEFFMSRENNNENTFQYKIPYSADLQFRKGEYFLGTYCFTIKRTIYNQKQSIELQIPVLYEKSTDSIIQNEELAENFMGRAQKFLQSMDALLPIDEDLPNKLRYKFTTYISEKEEEKKNFYTTRLESTKQLEIIRQNEYFSNKIGQIEQTIERITNTIQSQHHDNPNDVEINNLNKILPAQKGQLEKLKKEKSETIEKINSCRVETSTTQLISLSHVIVE